MNVLTVGILSAIAGIGGYALYERSLPDAVAVAEVRPTNCQARLDNWFDREGDRLDVRSDNQIELIQAKQRRYTGYQAMMGDCLK